MADNQRSYNTTWILSLVLGTLGVDRFYMGYIGLGILKLLTSGGFGVWYLVDLILILTGQMKDANGQALAGYEQGKKASWWAVGISLAASAALVFLLLLLVVVLGGLGYLGHLGTLNPSHMMRWT